MKDYIIQEEEHHENCKISNKEAKLSVEPNQIGTLYIQLQPCFKYITKTILSMHGILEYWAK